MCFVRLKLIKAVRLDVHANNPELIHAELFWIIFMGLFRKTHRFLFDDVVYKISHRVLFEMDYFSGGLLLMDHKRNLAGLDLTDTIL